MLSEIFFRYILHPNVNEFCNVQIYDIHHIHKNVESSIWYMG